MLHLWFRATICIVVLHIASVINLGPAAEEMAPAAMKRDAKVAAPESGQDPIGLDESAPRRPNNPGEMEGKSPGGERTNGESNMAGNGMRPNPIPPAGGLRDWTAVEILLSCGLLLFAVFVFSLQAYLMKTLKWTWTAVDFLRFNGLILIIIGALLLVTTGYSENQIAPVLGLLATIAGYLLGSGNRTVNSTEPDSTIQPRSADTSEQIIPPSQPRTV